MKILETDASGLIEIYPNVYADDRGFFLESYSETVFATLGLPTQYVQDNHSASSKGVIRGLHFQHNPHAQGKLVRVAYGRALDVVVDLRSQSPTFGKVYYFELDAKRCNMVYVPIGFAHGFAALEDHTVFLYKCTAGYHKASEGGIRYDDPFLNINWGIDTPIVSEKDLQLPVWSDFIPNNMF